MDKSCILMGIRRCRLKLYHFSRLITLSWRHLEIAEAGRAPWPPPFILKVGHTFPIRKVPSLTQEGNILIPGDSELMPKWICTSQPINNPYLSLFPPYTILSRFPINTAPNQTPFFFVLTNLHSLLFFVKIVYKLSGLCASLGLHFLRMKASPKKY